jgi:hypothetical protein
MVMMKRMEVVLASVTTVVFSAAFALLLYLLFVFPKVLAGWADQDRALPVMLQLLANLSMFCVSFGILLLPACVLAVMASILWIIVAARKTR